jgi:L-ascorbate metabolism protein UlaG (beta-lactamase superfamily)
LAKQTGAQVITNFEVANWLSAKGVERCMGLNHGSSMMPFGELTYTWATHSSSLPDGTYGGNPGGFLIKKTSGTFYYAGDTGLHQEFKTLGVYGP